MPAPETRFAVLLFTDIVGSTELKARYGVPAYSEALRAHNGHFERISHECLNIRTLQSRGDGYFAEAGSIAEAVRFALLFEEAMRAGPWGEVRLAVRVGIHAGEVGTLNQEDGTWIVGPAADLAARITDLAMGGQILLTRFPFDEARHFIREHPPVAGKPMPPLCWLAHGPYLLKGRDEPMDIFEVGAEGLAPLTAPPDGDKAKRAIRPGEEETLGWRPAVGLEIPGRTGWQLTERLGAGGFGEVWTGEHAKLRQRRAFKFCFDDERLRALKREVTLVRLLRTALGERDDIVHIHELKLDAPPFYLESDLAPHGNLLQWAESQGGLDKIPLAQRIALVAHTATALAAAHSIGVLHKDIKPTNILIFDGPGGEPRPRLVDFGIGTLADPAVLGEFGVTAAGFTHTNVNHSTGTPTYSPPEYLAGKPYTIQGDIYGLGVLLYQLITAKPLDPLAQGWEREIADPLLREDIAACVDGDPARRLPSAADLAERLLHLDERRAEIVERERLAREAASDLMRHTERRTRMVTAALGVLLAVAAGLLALFQMGGAVVSLGYDLPFAFHRAGSPSDVRLVLLDELDGAALDRRDQAEILRKLKTAGASAVIYDIIFNRPSADPAVDLDFAAAMREFREVPADAVSGARGKRLVFLACERKTIDQAGVIGEQLIPPTGVLLNAADDFGLVTLTLDERFCVRKLSTGSRDEASVTWKAAVALGAKLNEKDRLLPRWINFAGPPHTIPSCSADDVLLGVEPGFLRGKVVIVGGNPELLGVAAGTDLFSTPFHRLYVRSLPLMGGAEMQGNILASLLRGDFLTRLSQPIELVLVVVFGLASGALLAWLRPLLALGVAVTAIAGLILAGVVAVQFSRMWFAWPVLAFVQMPVALVWRTAASFYVELLRRTPLSSSAQRRTTPPHTSLIMKG